MYVVISSKTYTEITNLDFSPQADVTSDSVPVNTLSVDINTDDDIKVGRFIKLYDDLDQLWAKYWIAYTDRRDSEFLHVEAKSIIGLLDRKILAPAIYTSATQIEDVINSLFATVRQVTGVTCHEIEEGAETKTIKGYFPKQTARQRLQWICFATNLYIQQAFNEKVQIKTLKINAWSNIPKSKTFWRPSVDYQDYVTSIKIMGYSFAAGTPVSGDDYVKVGGQTYIRTEIEYELTNDNAPSSAIPNEISIDGIYNIHDGNADNVLTRLALIYFERCEVDADVINNRQYSPGQKVNIHLDDERDAKGYIESARFRFGVQARSRLKIVGAETRSLTNLTIRYVYKGSNIADKKYSFPVGYEYQITNPYLDKTAGNNRYIYRPLNEYATGTITTGNNVNTQQIDIALHWMSKQKQLKMISVSELSFDSESKVLTIG